MEIYRFGNMSAPVILIQPVDGHDLSAIENEIRLIEEDTDRDFGIICIKVDSWNNDLSPWKAPAVFRNESFGEGALLTLEKILQICDDKTKTYYIGGYSLAGLFSIWAAYNTDVFKGVAAASPSVWFPDFIQYMSLHNIECEAVYLSLGDKEGNTRNKVMSTVNKCIEEAYEMLKIKGIDTVLEWNSGGHFKDADIRTAKAFSWLLNRS
ncbi:MAG: esterase [Lachnospiraceae bacterium]|nr:esterase [Lachnospiraceae bacterium]